jgi:branched-chain amino acid transport system substrate-binding protein
MIKTFFIIIATWTFFIPGTYALQNTSVSNKTIKIGLLISDNRSKAARNGAELAISKANEKEGPEGLHFQLVVRSLEGPWGTGSKEAVNLIFDEDVWAILGSHNGRNAHLVEQVITKSRIVFVSAWASDPTLSQAFVPWYFSCVPNTNQQADVLIHEIYDRRKSIKVAALSDREYDSKLALNSFVKKTKTAGIGDLLQFFYDSSCNDFNNLLDSLNNENINCIILFGQPSASIKILQQMRQKKMNQSVFGTLSLLGENEYSDVKITDYENVIIVAPEDRSKSNGVAFRQDYERSYGKIPGTIAAYAFDGMNLIIEAIKNSGPDRNKIQKSLKELNFEGITGIIRFDEKGHRLGDPELIQIKNGIPVFVNKD